MLESIVQMKPWRIGGHEKCGEITFRLQKILCSFGDVDYIIPTVLVITSLSRVVISPTSDITLRPTNTHRQHEFPVAMKTIFATSALAMVGCTEAFVAPSAARAALAPSTSLDTSRATSAVRASTPSMEFAGGLRGADGPEPNSKNFDPLGLSEARPENLLFFRESEIKVCVVVFDELFLRSA